MKCLLFNHHPDYFYHLWRAFTANGITVHCATNQLTIAQGAPYSSLDNENRFELAGNYFNHVDLFPDLRDLVFSNTLEGYDFYFTHMRPLAEGFSRQKLFFGATVEWDLDFIKTGVTKVTSLKNAYERLHALYMQYYVPESELVHDKKYITVIAANWGNITFLNEISILKEKGIPVIISGNQQAPDKFQKDSVILPQTALLAHEKYYGTNCNSVCKALDRGIPVYTTRKSYEKLGFTDLPETLFFFKEQISIEDAYREALINTNNALIQETYRDIRPFSKTVECAKTLLNYL